MVTKKSAFLSLSLVLGVGLFPGSPHTHAQSTIRVGIVDTYTGPAATFTLDVLDGFKLAVNEMNAAGGVLGKKMEYATRDDKFDPAVALAMAQELLLKEKAAILMGTTNSETALALSDLAKKEKVPFFVTLAKSDRIVGERGHPCLFNMNENTAMAGRAAALALAKKSYQKYWIAGDDYEYGHAIADGVWNNLKKLKPQVRKVGETWWKVGETDFAPHIARILAAKPDFIIVATGGSGMVNFQRAAKTTGLNSKIPFYQHTAIDHSVLEPQDRNAPEGVFGTANYFFYHPDTASNRAFVNGFRKAYNRDPRAGALSGYMTARFIAEGYKKAGRIDTEALIKALENLSLESPVGPLAIRGCDHQLELPMYFGVTKKNPKYDFLVAGDIQVIQAKDYMPACEEVLRTRR